MPSERRARMSLTRTDLTTSSGLELLEILQCVTEDGVLNREESEHLRSWLAQHETTGLAASGHLKSIVDEILKDGVITDAELALLHDAILKVLPPDLRPIAVLRRRERQTAAREEARIEREKQRDQERADRERVQPLQRADFMVAGATIHAERREACESCSEGESVTLEREPDNPADRNAIRVIDVTGLELGYVPRDLARGLAPLLDHGAQQSFSIKKGIETSSGYVIPVVWGALYRSDVSAAELPPRSGPRKEQEAQRITSPDTSRIVGSPAPAPSVTRSPAPGKRHKHGCVICAVGGFVVLTLVLWILSLLLR